LPLLRAAAFVLGIDLDLTIGEFGVYAQEFLNPEAPVYSANPDVVVLALQTRDIARELWTRGARVPGETLAEVRTRVVEDYRSYVKSFHSRSRAQLIVHGLECLAVDQVGVLDYQAPGGQIETTQLINHDLARLAKEEGFYLLNYDGLVARHG